MNGGGVVCVCFLICFLIATKVKTNDFSCQIHNLFCSECSFSCTKSRTVILLLSDYEVLD